MKLTNYPEAPRPVETQLLVFMKISQDFWGWVISFELRPGRPAAGA